MKYLVFIIIIGVLFGTGAVLAQDVDQRAVTIWKTSWSWAKKIVLNVWDYIYGFLSKEVEQRRPDVEQEFQKELQEMKEDIPKTTNSLWQRLKNLFN